MPGVWITYKSPEWGVSGMNNEQLIGVLDDMAERGRNSYSPSAIKAAFQVAAKRKLFTPDEADAAISEVLRIPVAKAERLVGGVPG